METEDLNIVAFKFGTIQRPRKIAYQTELRAQSLYYFTRSIYLWINHIEKLVWLYNIKLKTIFDIHHSLITNIYILLIKYMYTVCFQYSCVYHFWTERKINDLFHLRYLHTCIRHSYFLYIRNRIVPIIIAKIHGRWTIEVSDR